MEDFYAAGRRTRETSRDLAHVRFCGATEYEDLLGFVMEFGPVLATPNGRGRDPDTSVFMQNVSVLRAQQALFASIWALVSLVNQLDSVSEWMAEAKGELRPHDFTSRSTREDRRNLAALVPAVDLIRNKLVAAIEESSKHDLEDEFVTIRAELERFATGRDELDNLSTSHDLLCTIFNVFPPKLYHGHGIVQECPGSDNSGTRPQLFFLLRKLYLMKAVSRLCKREDCGEFFIGRGNAFFCSVECGNVYRQRRSSAKNRRPSRA